MVGNSEKLWAGVCLWNFEYTPYSYNFQTTEHTYSYNLHVKKIPYSYNRRVLVNTCRAKTDNLLGNYMQNTAAFCFLF